MLITNIVKFKIEVVMVVIVVVWVEVLMVVLVEFEVLLDGFILVLKHLFVLEQLRIKQTLISDSLVFEIVCYIVCVLKGIQSRAVWDFAHQTD